MLKQPIEADSDTQWIADRLQEGLELLSVGYFYSEKVDSNPREFAVSCDALHATGLNECDFRWLLVHQLAEHYIELTLPGDKDRSFRSGGASICSTSCFMLTEAGYEFALRISSLERSEMASLPRSIESKPVIECQASCPVWDDQRQELTFGGQLIKRFRLPSPNQAAILSAFQEDDWPPRIDDPLTPRPEQDPKRRLHDTIRNLNRSHRVAALRFVGDGSGQGVLWDRITPNAESR